MKLMLVEYHRETGAIRSITYLNATQVVEQPVSPGHAHLTFRLDQEPELAQAMLDDLRAATHRFRVDPASRSLLQKGRM